MDDNPINTEQVRQYVDDRFRQIRFRMQFIAWMLHLIIFAFAFLSAQPLPPESLIPILGWVFGLAIHAWAVWLQSAAGERYVRRVIAAQAVKEVIADVANSAALAEPQREKAKHTEFALSDDGELIPLDASDSDAESSAENRDEPPSGQMRIGRSGRR